MVMRSYLAIVFLMFFFLENGAARANLVVRPEAPVQGRTVVVLLTDEAAVSAQMDFFGKMIPFYGSAGDLYSIAGVPVMTEPGYHVITVYASSESGNTYVMPVSIHVLKGKFLAEKLAFPPSKSGKLVASKIRADQDELSMIFRQWTPDRLWSGKFLMPIKGRITSPFGAYRHYNGKRLGDHRGTDIGGNPVGAVIKAANSGVVAFAKHLPALGSVIVIDHGQGIHSVYMHMSKTLVAAGETVKKGQTIGKVGSTGVSTGPHLHFGISVHDTRVEPMEWVKREVL